MQVIACWISNAATNKPRRKLLLLFGHVNDFISTCTGLSSH